MSSGDWEEVKRLAADFQRAQLTSTSQRLTETNCVEIVNKLIELKLLDVVFTTDGREYVTPAQIAKEIQDELYVHGGRLGIPALSLALQLSHTTLESRLQDFLKTDKNIHYVLGQLITPAYLDRLCEELNEKLTQDGVISISEASKLYDLPGEFLQDQINKRLGKIIHGKKESIDSDIVYTEGFVRRNTARIRGILSGVTKPSHINPIRQKIHANLPEQMFFGIVAKLLKSKRVDGILSGKNRAAYFIPNCYIRTQNQWIDAFMSGNGYVDLEAASRLGISDPKSFVSKRFGKEQKLVLLSSVCLGEEMVKQFQMSVEESLQNPGWLTIDSILPFTIDKNDSEILLSSIDGLSKEILNFGNVVMSKKLIEECNKHLSSNMADKASKEVKSGAYMKILNENQAVKTKKNKDLSEDTKAGKKEERRKKAAVGKSGGGTQGRETKTKSTKKKYMAGKHKDEHWSGSSSEDESSKGSHEPKTFTFEFMSLDDLKKQISRLNFMQDAPPELIDRIASFVRTPLNSQYEKLLKQTMDAFISEKFGRRSVEELMERCQKLTIHMQLYKEGLEKFEGDVKTQLERFLLRSFGHEVITATTQFLIAEAGLDVDTAKFPDLPHSRMKDALASLGACTKVEEFMTLLDEIVPGAKRSKFQLICLEENKSSLMAQMEQAMSSHSPSEPSDPALFLHIASLLLFTCINPNCLLQANGKFVPNIITYLKGFLEPTQHELLRSCQTKVIDFIKSKQQNQDIRNELDEMLPAIKKLVLSFSKT